MEIENIVNNFINNDIKSNLDERSKYFTNDMVADYSKKYFILNDAITHKSKVLILYRNLNQEWQERYIHPLQFFKYDNVIYVTAFCELRNDIRHFELNRMKIVE